MQGHCFMRSVRCVLCVVGLLSAIEGPRCDIRILCMNVDFETQTQT